MEDIVSPEQALALKELGFNLRCSDYYENDNLKYFNLKGLSVQIGESEGWNFNNSFLTCCSAPTYSKVFKWFRDKHLLHSFVDIYPTKEEPNRCWFMIRYMDRSIEEEEDYMSGWFNTQDKAEPSCVRKLIELIKK